MATHTEGPWTWFDYPDGRKLLASPSRAVIHCPDAVIACEPADERLIGAAPDLLAALKAIVAKVDETSECDHSRLSCEEIGCIGAQVKSARAAIAKAESAA